VLDRENIGQITIVSLGPDVAAGCDFVELRRDPYPFALFPHTAFDDVSDAEFVGNLLEVNGLSLVHKGGVARDNIEPPQLRKGGDDIFTDAVGKILLFGFAAEV